MLLVLSCMLCKQEKTQELQKPKLCYHAKLGQVPFYTPSSGLSHHKVVATQACTSQGEAGESFPLAETDFYTPPVLGGTATFDNSAPAMYTNPVP